MDTIENTFSFGKLMDSYPGKVVYLDIWGLSCGPCRAAMPDSKKLRDKLNGKPVEFVFLTAENMDSKRWVEAYKVSLTNKSNYVNFKQFKSKTTCDCIPLPRHNF